MFKKYRGRKSWGRIDFTPGGLKLAKYLFENQFQAFFLITMAFPPLAWVGEMPYVSQLVSYGGEERGPIGVIIAWGNNNGEIINGEAITKISLRVLFYFLYPGVFYGVRVTCHNVGSHQCRTNRQPVSPCTASIFFSNKLIHSNTTAIYHWFQSPINNNIYSLLFGCV